MERHVSADRVHKLQSTGQIHRPPVFVDKVLFEHSPTGLFKSCLCLGQTFAVVTENLWTAKLEMFIIWLFREKLCQPPNSVNQFHF